MKRSIKKMYMNKDWDKSPSMRQAGLCFTFYCVTSPPVAFLSTSCELHYWFPCISSPLLTLPHSPTRHLWMPLSHGWVELDVQQILTKKSKREHSQEEELGGQFCVGFSNCELDSSSADASTYLRFKAEVPGCLSGWCGWSLRASLSALPCLNTWNRMNESHQRHRVVVANIKPRCT